MGPYGFWAAALTGAREEGLRASLRGGTDGWMDGWIDKWNFSPFYRTLSLVGAAAQKLYKAAFLGIKSCGK